ncbi:MAG: cupin domain-containing protein [Microbacterium sp.]|uniref:cupin domain-containing protein n=1 Tax=Microbacterium sp. TaxID=51671 RepID=UPI002718EDDF|nr:cupin domain-containing protein [Microbacterium sp.]MDO8383848.1 cupin domain-containing protein [Microbacterium sp.]
MAESDAPLTEADIPALLQEIERLHHRDDQHVEEKHLVSHSSDALWLRGNTGNPSHIGMMRHVPMKTAEFALQMIPGHSATDLQRHVHESVHYVIRGTGWSEIGDQTVPWGPGDFIYTPPWIWHRHYAGDTDVDILIVENSRLLNLLDAGMRDTRGSVSFVDEFGSANSR